VLKICHEVKLHAAVKMQQARDADSCLDCLAAFVAQCTCLDLIIYPACNNSTSLNLN